MTRFFNEIERSIKIVSDNTLEVALHYMGQDMVLTRPQKTDVFSKVHAKNAGGDYTKIKVFVGIIQSDDFSSSDGNFSANFEEGFLFTKCTDILVGDVIVVDSGGGIHKLKVESREDIGYTTDMFVKWKLSNRN